MESPIWKIWLTLAWLALIPVTLALYEDQVDQNDWTKRLIGTPTLAVLSQDEPGLYLLT